MVRTPSALVLSILALAACAPASAQDIPRTSWGKPDFTGYWTNRSTTQLERPAQFRNLVVSADDAARIAEAAKTAAAEANAPSDLSEGHFDDGNTEAGYNAFWVDPGDKLAVVRGEARSSLIVSPANGRIPYKNAAESLRLVRAEGAEYRSGAGDYLGPEDVPLRERCLIGFGNVGGPVMLSALYNNTYQFVLTPDHLMVLTEMVHDARAIPIFSSQEAARHRPPELAPWLGDTVAWWEGDTLVTRIRNLKPAQSATTRIPLSSEGQVIERFTRVGQNEILYQFEVEDPVHYSEAWRGETTFYRPEGRLYEYACHEGNYAMTGILAGARRMERLAADARANGNRAPPVDPTAGRSAGR
ncbi:MAG: hypothetical protein KGS00_10570 [Alphaproteobacteria bacterium]|nr:hypothetical protein [Alphaproteobacteria bacterium]